MTIEIHAAVDPGRARSNNEDSVATDDSVALVERVAGERKRDLTLVVNSVNSGSSTRTFVSASDS